jgi:hypothetical protein
MNRPPATHLLLHAAVGQRLKRTSTANAAEGAVDVAAVDEAADELAGMDAAVQRVQASLGTFETSLLAVGKHADVLTRDMLALFEGTPLWELCIRQADMAQQLIASLTHARSSIHSTMAQPLSYFAQLMDQPKAHLAALHSSQTALAAAPATAATGVGPAQAAQQFLTSVHALRDARLQTAGPCVPLFAQVLADVMRTMAMQLESFCATHAAQCRVYLAEDPASRLLAHCVIDWLMASQVYGSLRSSSIISQSDLAAIRELGRSLPAPGAVSVSGQQSSIPSPLSSSSSSSESLHSKWNAQVAVYVAELRKLASLTPSVSAAFHVHPNGLALAMRHACDEPTAQSLTAQLVGPPHFPTPVLDSAWLESVSKVELSVGA